MGLFKKSKAQKETAAFRKIVAKRTTQAGRKAFVAESEKVAIERARAKARRPTIGQLVAKRVTGAVERKVSGTTRRRRKVIRRTVRSIPVRKKRRKTTTRKAPANKLQPINFSEGIFS